MKDVTPTSLLKDRKREIEGNPDFSNKDVGASQPQLVSEIKSGIVSPVNQVELPLEVASPSNSGGHTHLLSQVCLVRNVEHLSVLLNVRLKLEAPRSQCFAWQKKKKAHLMKCALGTLFWLLFEEARVPRHTYLFYCQKKYESSKVIA